MIATWMTAAGPGPKITPPESVSIPTPIAG